MTIVGPDCPKMGLGEARKKYQISKNKNEIAKIQVQ